MKLKQWLYGAAALAMLAACSDKDIAPGGGDDPNGNGQVSEATGYLAVEIKLPQESATRAEDAEDKGAMNDNFADGIKAEYEVKNAMIIVFKGGSDEKSATFYKAYDLIKPFFDNMPTDDQITSSYIAAIPVNKLNTNGTEHYYGLVVLNRDGTTTNVISGSSGQTDNVKLGGITLSQTTKLSDILEYITTIGASTGSETEFINANGFFMTNAPLSNKLATQFVSADENIRYLSDLGSKTYETMAEAKQKVSNCIYVERAVAKVTSGITENATSFMTIVDKNGNEIKDVKVNADVSYCLTNTNLKSYVVRNVESAKLGDHFSWTLASTQRAGKYRMIGSTPMPGLDSPFHSGSATEEETGVKYEPLYRTYWCHDPNYNKNIYKDGEAPAEGETTTAENVTGNEMYVATDADLKPISNNILYCRENTFDVKHQNNGNSTMVVYKIAFTVEKTGLDKDGGLYIKDGDHTKVYVKKEDACWDEISRIINDKDIQNALTKAIEKSPAIKDYADENGVIKNAEKYLNFEIAKDEDNLLLINSVSINQDSGITQDGIDEFNSLIGSPTGKNEAGAAVGSQVQANLLTRVNGLSEIIEYTQGVSYYYIPVKHFGDYYCPWPDNITGTTTQAVYNGGAAFGANDNHAKDYLGRYGMVRNNWYDLSISKIEAIGEPSFPSINVTLSDDNKEEKRYIGVEIHVLSWAKRTQNVEF